MSDSRLIVDRAQAGPWNMAVDELLLERAAAERQSAIRLYQWSAATVSLGYFQSVAARSAHQASQHSPLVRRASGGGAIVHDREITYSLALPWHRGAGEAATFCRHVHRAFVGMLSQLGAKATLAAAEPPAAAAAAPFLCFQRRAPGDVMVGDHKVIGSAQRRVRGALLQHGSILLKASPAAPELPGIMDLANLDLTLDEWLERIRQALSLAMDGALSAGTLSDEETAAAAALVATKFGSQTWNYRR